MTAEMKVQLILVVAIFLSTSSVLGDSNHKVRPECYQSVDYGECADGSLNLTRFYYDAVEDKCKEFIFGGCNGNSNRFRSSHACLGYCKKTPENVCKQPSKFGDCWADLRRYFYDPAEQKCKEFTYGGCEGNDNNFMHAKTCNAFCNGV